MGVDSKALLVLKNPHTNPMDVINLVVKGLNRFIEHQNKKIPENFKKDHPEKYTVIMKSQLSVDRRTVEGHEYGFIYFSYFNDQTEHPDYFVERRKMYFGWGTHLNEENKEFDFTKDKTMMLLSTYCGGLGKGLLQEIFIETNELTDPYIDINDCDDIDYENFNTFYKKYGEAYLLMRDL